MICDCALCVQSMMEDTVIFFPCSGESGCVELDRMAVLSRGSTEYQGSQTLHVTSNYCWEPVREEEGRGEREGGRWGAMGRKELEN